MKVNVNVKARTVKARTSLLIAFIAAISCPAIPHPAQALAPATPKHRMLLEDEGNAALLLVDENGGPGWTTALPGNGRDLQLIGGNRVLTGSFAGGYFEIDLKDGSVAKRVQGFGEVQSARRLPDGHTLLAGNNLGGSQGIVVLDLDPRDQLIGKVIFPGLSTLRLMRLTAQGHLLFGSNAQLIEADRLGKILWQTELPGAVIYKALRLRNGSVWASTGYSATLALTGADKHPLLSLGGAALPKDVNAHFFADFQLLPNGHIVVANWQNHGPGHGGEGIQVLEMDSTGAVVWQYHQDAAKISSLDGLLVLDGLDTNLGYDEREGFQIPWSTTSILSARPHQGRRPESVRSGAFIQGSAASIFSWPFPELMDRDGRLRSPDGRAISASTFFSH